jgi:hypothetical protein
VSAALPSPALSPTAGASIEVVFLDSLMSQRD